MKYPHDLYLVIVEDRHVDTDVLPFSTEGAAIGSMTVDDLITSTGYYYDTPITEEPHDHRTR